MADASVQRSLAEMVAERDWEQFHTVENLIKSISIESAELLECIQWGGDADEVKVREELADVLSYCLLLTAKLGLDPDEIVLAKLEETKAKYPIDKARGSSAKYDQLSD